MAQRKRRRPTARRWIGTVLGAAALGLGFAGTWWLLQGQSEHPAAAPERRATSAVGEPAASPAVAPASDARAMGAERGLAGAGRSAAPVAERPAARTSAPQESLSDSDRRGLEDVLRRPRSAGPRPGD